MVPRLLFRRFLLFDLSCYWFSRRVPDTTIGKDLLAIKLIFFLSRSRALFEVTILVIDEHNEVSVNLAVKYFVLM